jgi:glucose-1-phosphatase
MSDIQNIIFDYGNVLYKIDFKLAIQAFQNLGISNASEIFGHLSQSELFDELDRGNISPAQFREGIRSYTDIPLTDAAIDEAWNALLIGIPPHRILLLQQLKTHYRLFLLSNNNEIHYKAILEYLDQHQFPRMESLFVQTYYSQHTGMRKPEPEIFQLVLNDHSLNPAHTLFIDDSPIGLANFTVTQL